MVVPPGSPVTNSPPGLGADPEACDQWTGDAAICEAPQYPPGTLATISSGSGSSLGQNLDRASGAAQHRLTSARQSLPRRNALMSRTSPVSTMSESWARRAT